MKGQLQIRLAAAGAALALGLASCSSEERHTMFHALPPEETGIHFANELTQTQYFNIIEYLYFYNGGGVAIGDINNDGLDDLYFTANQLQNRLYLNKGGFVFEDITDKAGVQGDGNWKTGATMADVNGDGFLDMFICGVGNYKDFKGRNQLFINNQDLTFSDQTEAYGLAFEGFSTHASFFDYDRDGDLDLYLLNHSVHSIRSVGDVSLRYESDSLAGDKLYRNDLIPRGTQRFTDVTKEAKILNSQVGYGLGVGVSDLNQDGWMDIYVSNDFQENDYLYINRGDGTFEQTTEKSTGHVSRFSMGNDIGDINHDGLPDIITLDMLPRDEGVIKTTAGEDPYDIYQFKLSFGYHHQFARNVLLLNRGRSRGGDILFSDIAPLVGVEASDWSWAPLLADFDNDGNRDLFIGNGIVTRPNDLDYMNFISTDSAQRYYDYETFIENMPSGKVPNIIFRNKGGLRFADVTDEWMGVEPTVTTGAAYADLDNDGDLDLVLNNINAKATVFRNDQDASLGGWLQFVLEGAVPNRFGVGTKVIAFAGSKQFLAEQVLSRGWQSSVSPVLHLGIGSTEIDSVCVIWPDGKFQTLKSPGRNRRIRVSEKDARRRWRYKTSDESSAGLLARMPNDPFRHKENDFDAFAAEKTIPHMLSTQGPKISVGDVDGDGIADFFVGGAAGQPGAIYKQHEPGEFVHLLQPAVESDSLFEDTASAFADVDGDGFPDLVVGSGGQQFPEEHPMLRLRCYLNDGSGAFRKDDRALPPVFVNASCIAPADFDKDGDTDLFVGGRVVAGKYGIDPRSYLLMNDGHGKFEDVSSWLGVGQPEGNVLGMVTAAVWADVNADERPDLVIVGEWMPITLLIQRSDGTFSDQSQHYGLAKTNGWWNTIAAADMDNDGDVDFVAGNMGTNSRLRADPQEPVSLYVGDIDHNGGIDHLLTYFNNGQQYPFISRDQLVKQVPSFKREFLRYASFRHVTREQIIPSEDTDSFVVKNAHYFSSMYIRNDNGQMNLSPLPQDAQMFPIFGFAHGDFNDDGNPDLLAVGNLHAVQPDLGRYDAGYGLMMLGDGKAGFQALSLQDSGFLVQGEGRDVVAVPSGRGEIIYLVTRNNQSVLSFAKRKP